MMQLDESPSRIAVSIYAIRSIDIYTARPIDRHEKHCSSDNYQNV